MKECLSVLSGIIEHSWNVTVTQSDFVVHKRPIVLRNVERCLCGWRTLFLFCQILVHFMPQQLTLGVWSAPPRWGLRGSQTAQGHFHWLAAGGAEHQNGPLELSIPAACRSSDPKQDASWAQMGCFLDFCSFTSLTSKYTLSCVPQ